MPKKLKVYLAGPDVFKFDAKKILNRKKKFLRNLGYQPLSPYDLKSDNASEIYANNICLIDECDIVAANVEPFRGSHVDDGTAFELGYAVALNKKIILYSDVFLSPLKNRIIEYPQADFPVVENFGLPHNLMICMGIIKDILSFENAILLFDKWGKNL